MDMNSMVELIIRAFEKPTRSLKTIDWAIEASKITLYQPLNIQYYKPPNENRYKPKLPNLEGLPEEVRLDIAIRKCMHFARCNGKTLTTLKEIERILSDG